MHESCAELQALCTLAEQSSPALLRALPTTGRRLHGIGNAAIYPLACSVAAAGRPTHRTLFCPFAVRKATVASAEPVFT